MKGIILAGGKATRLFPSSKVLSKQMMPVYDKPMIYYPLSILMLANISEVLIISTSRDFLLFKELLGNGKHLGMHLQFIIQENPTGVSQAFVLGENFIENDSVCLILGDNIFYGKEFSNILLSISIQEQLNGAYIFGYYVKNPQIYGVVNFNKNGKVLSIEEKPNNPKSNYAVPGLYFYDYTVVKRAKRVKLSLRGEYEITALNQDYLRDEKLTIKLLNHEVFWLDIGNSDSLLDASCFISMTQKQQGFYIACIEEIAWRNGWITNQKLQKIAKSMGNTKYGHYLLSLVR